MPRTTTAFVLATLLATPAAFAQEPAMSDAIEYRIGWDNPATQLYTVRATAPVEGADEVVFSLPAWRPGRYILQYYASNVQSVRAFDGDGDSLPVRWIDLDSWRIEPGDAEEVSLEYEYYARTLDAGSSTLTPDFAYFNPVNLLPWVEGRMDRPARLTLEAPAEWTSVTQLDRVGEPHVFAAPDYHALVDAPTIAAPDLTIYDFTLRDVPYHLVFRGEVDLGDRTPEDLVADVEAMTREQVALFGGAPFEEYWHLYQLVPFQIGHAVEHASSASYVFHEAILANAYLPFLGTTSHELFHAWNVKRIRPAAMWPYDYSEPQLTRLHWVNEGVTSYYDDLVLRRAGIYSDEKYHDRLAENIRSHQTLPGRKVTSASLASLTSWHSGYGAANPNKAISFYTKGALLGLLLDMEIRDATDGEKSLDDVMRHLWEEYYLEDRGVPEDGFQDAVETLAGREFDEFFARYVHGVDELPYDEVLDVVGLDVVEVEDEDEPAATLGVSLRKDDEEIVIGGLRPDSPALEAGIMRDDVLVSIDGEEIDSVDLDSILEEREPGEVVEIEVRRHDETRTFDVTLAGGGNLTWKVRPAEEPTERQLEMRETWLAPVAE